MPYAGQQPIKSETPIHALSEIISPLRLGTYLNASGHDADRALRLYLWNAKIGEAFHIPIQSVEVGLRNRVSDGLTIAFGAEWWQDKQFQRLAGARRCDDIEMVWRRLDRKGKTMAGGQVVAGLSFGFWVDVLDKRFFPAIWSVHLADAFPHIPGDVDHGVLRTETRKVADLRNKSGTTSRSFGGICLAIIPGA